MSAKRELRGQLLSAAMAWLAVAGIGILVWLYGIYSGDDRNTLMPVARHSIDATLHYYIRPLEYYAVQFANSVYLPLWIAISVTAAVAAAALNVRTAEILSGSSIDPRLRALVIAASPVWFYVVSQVDTVSEALCNLFFALALLNLTRLLFASNGTGASGHAVAVNLSSALLLFTKELAVAAALAIPAVAAWQQLKHRRLTASYLLSGAMLVVAIGSWIGLKIAFRGMLPEAGGHYNMSPGLMDVARNTIATLAFPLTPLPSSLLSTALLAPVWTTAGVVATLIFVWSLRTLDWRSVRVKWCAAAVAASCFPMFYVHASELYASMAGSLFLALLVLYFQLRIRSPLLVAYCCLLLCCSYMNAIAYYMPDIFQAANLKRTEYSVYFGPNGQYYGEHPITHVCPVRAAKAVEWHEQTINCL